MQYAHCVVYIRHVILSVVPKHSAAPLPLSLFAMMRLSLSNKKFRGMDLIFKALTCLSGTFLSFTPLTWMKYRVLSSSMAFSHLSVSASIVTAYIASLSLYLSFAIFRKGVSLRHGTHQLAQKVYQYIFFCNGVGVYFLFFEICGNASCSFAPMVVSFGST